MAAAARSFTNVKALSASLFDGFSHVLTRRGYAATAQSATRGGGTYVSGKITPKSAEDNKVIKCVFVYAVRDRKRKSDREVASWLSRVYGRETQNQTLAKSEKVAWVPDPVTGYYKPENIKEIDVAELRATLLSKKFNH